MRLLILGSLVVAVAACNTDVTNPDVVKSSNLTGAGALPAQLAGAYGDFGIAYFGSGYSGTFILGQAQEGQILATGLFTDELHESDYYTNHLQIDTRLADRDNITTEDTYRQLQRARQSNDQTQLNFTTYDPHNTGRLTVLNLAGFVDVMLAESFCSNVPLSSVDASGNITYSAPISTDSLLHAAEAKFNQVLSLGPGDANATGDASGVAYETSRAYVGLARALLDEGQFAAAGAAAHNVPDGYADSIERSANSPSEQNGVYYYTYQEVRYGISTSEGGNGLPFGYDGTTNLFPIDNHGDSIPDPRIALGGTSYQTTIGLDDITLDTLQQKYPGYGTSGQLATAVEARLIEAEAALQANNVGLYLTNLNDARSQLSPYLPVLTDPGSTDARVDTLFAERAYDLWLTGHRLGDLRRLIRPLNQGGYGRAQNLTFPSGAYFKAGIAYGAQVTLLIPRAEDDNPRYTDAGCHAGTVP